MNKLIKLGTEGFSIPAIDYAIQGNAILGIRESGKTFTAMKIAEGLMDAGIPFIAFDPIGIWKNLRIGKDGHKGYPVVVAAGLGDGDIPLTPDSVEGIVRAAMQENVALVLDLYSVLNKTYWRKIVETAVLTLLMENKDFGVRHLFIEEAAEFVPQKLGHKQFDVYSAIESMARMGGNVSLGYTLINQRAEDVNKSVLEIVERMIIHRQNGKNSLTGIESWLKVTRIVPNKIEEVMKSLPELPSGECFVCAKLEHEPTHITVAPKVTIHPNRRDPKTTFKAALALDVSGFVAKLKANLGKNAKDAEHQTPIKEKARQRVKAIVPEKKDAKIIFTPSVSRQDEIDTKDKEISQLRSDLAEVRTRCAGMEKIIKSVREKFLPDYRMLQSLFSELEKVSTTQSVDKAKYEIWISKFKGKNRDMLETLIERKRVSRAHLALLIVVPALKKGGSFNTYASNLMRVGLVKRENDDYVLQEVE